MTSGRQASHSDPVVVIGADPAHPPAGLDRLPADVRHARTAAELRSALQGAEVALLWDFRSHLLREVWPAESLRWVHVAAAGVDAVLFPELVDSDVAVTNSRGVFDEAIAEYVVGLMLAYAKDLPTTVLRQQERRWDYRTTELLSGATVLVIGAGSIGSAVAAKATCLGMTAVGVARSGRSDEPAFSSVVGAGELEGVLPEADFVVLALPLTPETRASFGRRELRAMRPSARLINVGRGPVVDEAALVEALQGREIAGAALDVFEQEPLPPDHALWSLPGVIVSPHMSGDYHGFQEVLVEMFAENLERWRSGRPLLNVVDKRLGYAAREAR